jgi:hypothetical protein
MGVAVAAVSVRTLLLAAEPLLEAGEAEELVLQMGEVVVARAVLVPMKGEVVEGLARPAVEVVEMVPTTRMNVSLPLAAEVVSCLSGEAGLWRTLKQMTEAAGHCCWLSFEDLQSMG